MLRPGIAVWKRKVSPVDLDPFSKEAKTLNDLFCAPNAVCKAATLSLIVLFVSSEVTKELIALPAKVAVAVLVPESPFTVSLALDGIATLTKSPAKFLVRVILLRDKDNLRASPEATGRMETFRPPAPTTGLPTIEPSFSEMESILATVAEAWYGLLSARVAKGRQLPSTTAVGQLTPTAAIRTTLFNTLASPKSVTTLAGKVIVLSTAVIAA